jgi:hypothetical protein
MQKYDTADCNSSTKGDKVAAFLFLVRNRRMLR